MGVNISEARQHLAGSEDPFLISHEDYTALLSDIERLRARIHEIQRRHDAFKGHYEYLKDLQRRATEHYGEFMALPPRRRSLSPLNASAIGHLIGEREEAQYQASRIRRGLHEIAVMLRTGRGSPGEILPIVEGLMSDDPPPWQAEEAPPPVVPA